MSIVKERTELMREALSRCSLCGRRCMIDRTGRGRRGPCGGGLLPKVARWVPHMGEEPPLSGAKGSGAIFFSGCSMRCGFCQNFSISQQGRGLEVSIRALAAIMIELQGMGCHNINLVSPTHYAPQASIAVDEARAEGLEIPVVYNTHGYDTPEALAWMAGRVDIYLPDMKYADDETARLLSGVPGYRETNREALKIMFSQVGHLVEDPDTGLASRGLLVRILVLPGNREGAVESLAYLEQRFTSRICVSLMAQYAPVYKALDLPGMGRTITEDEYRRVVDYAAGQGLTRVWIQDPDAASVGVPDFQADVPFNF